MPRSSFDVLGSGVEKVARCKFARCTSFLQTLNNFSPRTPGCPCNLKTDGVRTLTTMCGGLTTADKSSGSTNPACSSSWFSALAVVTSRATVASRLLPPIQIRSVSAGCAGLRLTTAAAAQALVNAQSAGVVSLGSVGTGCGNRLMNNLG